MVSRVKAGKDLEFTKKKFENTMTAQELSEIEIENASLNKNMGQLKIIKNKPHKIGNRPGFLLEYLLPDPGFFAG